MSISFVVFVVMGKTIELIVTRNVVKLDAARRALLIQIFHPDDHYQTPKYTK